MCFSIINLSQLISCTDQTGLPAIIDISSFILDEKEYPYISPQNLQADIGISRRDYNPPSFAKNSAMPLEFYIGRH